MARKYGTATLTLTVTEAITLNSKDEGQSHSHTISSIADVYRRTMTATTSTDTTIATFSSLFGVGQFVAADMRYLRITNLDDANFLTLTLYNGADSFFYKVAAGDSFVLMNNEMDAIASSTSFGAFADITQIKADADTAACDIEIIAVTA